MSFKDKLVYCETARRTFVHTIQRQRQAAASGDGDAMAYCDICRAKVQLAAVPHDEKTDGALPISALVREGCAFSSMELGAAPGIGTGSYGAGSPARASGGRGRGRRGPTQDSGEDSGEPSAQPSENRGGGRRGGGRQGASSDSGGGRGRRGGAKRGKVRGGRGGQRGGRRGPRREAQPQTDLRMRHEGTVKWFNYEKGYGFIAQDDGSDLFVHSSSILGKEQNELYEGQPVEYEVENAPRGAQAVYVIPLA